jgi:hypothetical protein
LGPRSAKKRAKKKKKGCYPGVKRHHSVAKVRVKEVLSLSQKTACVGVIKLFTIFRGRRGSVNTLRVCSFSLLSLFNRFNKFATSLLEKAGDNVWRRKLATGCLNAMVS